MTGKPARLMEAVVIRTHGLSSPHLTEQVRPFLPGGVTGPLRFPVDSELDRPAVSAGLGKFSGGFGLHTRTSFNPAAGMANSEVPTPGSIRRISDRRSPGATTDGCVCSVVPAVPIEQQSCRSPLRFQAIAAGGTARHRSPLTGSADHLSDPPRETTGTGNSSGIPAVFRVLRGVRLRCFNAPDRVSSGY